MISKDQLRRDFPQLGSLVHGKELLYLDSAATALKYKASIEKESQFLLSESANIHRGSHYYGSEGTKRFEETRLKIAKYFGGNIQNWIFTKGTTHGINQLAKAMECKLKSGDQILVSRLEHHSNFVPWFELAKRKNAHCLPIELKDYQIDLDSLKKNLTTQTKIIAITHQSNVSGRLQDLKSIVALCKEKAPHAFIFIDGAQAVASQKFSVEDIGCDAYYFSTHKMFASYGLGCLYLSERSIDALSQFEFGGSMVQDVSFEKVTYLKSPHGFEAGTPPIAQVISFGAVLDYLDRQFEANEIWDHEVDICKQSYLKLKELDLFELAIFNEDVPTNILSFVPKWGHAEDYAHILDKQGVAVRSGHLCCQPFLKSLGASSVLRISFSVYNLSEDVDKLFNAFKKAKEMLV